MKFAFCNNNFQIPIQWFFEQYQTPVINLSRVFDLKDNYLIYTNKRKTAWIHFWQTKIFFWARNFCIVTALRTKFSLDIKVEINSNFVKIEKIFNLSNLESNENCILSNWNKKSSQTHSYKNTCFQAW